jgi:hypothetical protein
MCAVEHGCSPEGTDYEGFPSGWVRVAAETIPSSVTKGDHQFACCAGDDESGGMLREDECGKSSRGPVKGKYVQQGVRSECAQGDKESDKLLSALLAAIFLSLFCLVQTTMLKS